MLEIWQEEMAGKLHGLFVATTLIIASVHYSIALKLLHTRQQETYFYYENQSTRFRNSKMFRLRRAKAKIGPLARRF